MPEGSPRCDIYYRLSELLLQHTSSIVFNALTKSDSFDEYERIIGITSPHRDFRRRLAVEIARYIDGAWMEAMSPAGDLKQKQKAAHHQLKITRNRLARARRPLMGNPDYDKAVVEAVYYRHELNKYKRPRGRVEKEFAAIFVQRAGDIFTSVTGERVSFINYGDQANGGAFGELLKAITRDTHQLAIALKLDRKRFSANLARYARHRQVTR
jgi:hypothetical protein